MDPPAESSFRIFTPISSSATRRLPCHPYSLSSLCRASRIESLRLGFRPPPSSTPCSPVALSNHPRQKTCQPLQEGGEGGRKRGEHEGAVLYRWMKVEGVIFRGIRDDDFSSVLDIAWKINTAARQRFANGDALATLNDATVIFRRDVEVSA